MNNGHPLYLKPTTHDLFTIKKRQKERVILALNHFFKGGKYTKLDAIDWGDVCLAQTVKHLRELGFKIRNYEPRCRLARYGIPAPLLSEAKALAKVMFGID